MKDLKPTPDPRAQIDKFRDLAGELECDDNEARRHGTEAITIKIER